MLSKSQAGYIAGIREKLSDALCQLDSTQSERDNLTSEITEMRLNGIKLASQWSRRAFTAERERDSLTAKIDALTRLHYPRDGENDHGPYTICDYDGTTWPCRTRGILASAGDDALRHVKAQALRDAASQIEMHDGTGGTVTDWLRDRADRIEAGE